MMTTKRNKRRIKITITKGRGTQEQRIKQANEALFLLAK